MDRSQFLKIGDVAKLLGVSPSSLRSWERRGLVAPPRTKGRYRLYSSQQIQELTRIAHLRKGRPLNTRAMVVLPQAAPTRAKESGTEFVAPERPGIGQRLRACRERAAMAPEDVAAKAGVSAARLAALERGNAKASIAAMKRLAQLYATNITALFDVRTDQRSLVRPRDRQSIDLRHGIRMERLASAVWRMQPYVFRIAPRSGSGGAYQHDGEEFMLMLQGQLEIWLDGSERFRLHPGDSLYFASTRAHRWRTSGSDEAIVLWINLPPK